MSLSTTSLQSLFLSVAGAILLSSLFVSAAVGPASMI